MAMLSPVEIDIGRWLVVRVSPQSNLNL